MTDRRKVIIVSDTAVSASMLPELTEREAQALILRHGLGGMAPAIYRVVGASMGVHGERALQLVAMAEHKLRKENRLQPVVDDPTGRTYRLLEPGEQA